VKSLFLVGVLGFAQVGLASPIFCGGSTSPYSLEIASNHKTAKLLVAQQPVRFGSLSCSIPSSAMLNGPFLICQSVNVADDGYNVVLATDNATAQTTASIGKIWKGGTRPLATLNCAVALHR